MEPLMGSIQLFAGNFAPNGWFTCEGQRLPINQYTALFSILGTTYGGDGITYFQLPDLRGSFPTQCTNISGSHPGGTYFLGEIGGQQNVILNAQQMPAHNHTVAINNTAATQGYATNNYIGFNADPETGAGINFYNEAPTAGATLAPASVSVAGGNQAVDVTPPFVAMQFIIAWTGIYPSRP
ncbi:phage tail protein [Mucilaginibacter gilvus]|uniref:Phage tail protein n=1 Tax=Mucilaginibacter gilvus TaxID=2305909 RepID=A0A444MH20_9SPHI|nr:tail fiber protein [Mucilaginibacter gilvus]RWY45986.1 phage tail protein [Mucilaginibacter gilvus]